LVDPHVIEAVQQALLHPVAPVLPPVMTRYEYFMSICQQVAVLHDDAWFNLIRPPAGTSRSSSSSAGSSAPAGAAAPARSNQRFEKRGKDNRRGQRGNHQRDNRHEQRGDRDQQQQQHPQQQQQQPQQQQPPPQPLLSYPKGKATDEMRAHAKLTGECLRCRTGAIHTSDKCPITIREIALNIPQRGAPASSAAPKGAAAPGAGQVKVHHSFRVGVISSVDQRSFGAIGRDATTSVEVAGTLVPCLIDTGATISIMYEATAAALGLATEPAPSPGFIPIRVCGGAVVHACRILQVPHFKLTPTSPANLAVFAVLPQQGETLIGQPELERHLIGLNPTVLIPYGDLRCTSDGIPDETIPLAKVFGAAVSSATTSAASSSTSSSEPSLARPSPGVRLPDSSVFLLQPPATGSGGGEAPVF
jgi:hypothetical protein